MPSGPYAVPPIRTTLNRPGHQRAPDRHGQRVAGWAERSTVEGPGRSYRPWTAPPAPDPYVEPSTFGIVGLQQEQLPAGLVHEPASVAVQMPCAVPPMRRVPSQVSTVEIAGIDVAGAIVVGEEEQAAADQVRRGRVAHRCRYPYEAAIPRIQPQLSGQSAAVALPAGRINAAAAQHAGSAGTEAERGGGAVGQTTDGAVVEVYLVEPVNLERPVDAAGVDDPGPVGSPGDRLAPLPVGEQFAPRAGQRPDGQRSVTHGVRDSPPVGGELGCAYCLILGESFDCVPAEVGAPERVVAAEDDGRPRDGGQVWITHRWPSAPLTGVLVTRESEPGSLRTAVSAAAVRRMLPRSAIAPMPSRPECTEVPT